MSWWYGCPHGHHLTPVATAGEGCPCDGWPVPEVWNARRRLGRALQVSQAHEAARAVCAPLLPHSELHSPLAALRCAALVILVRCQSCCRTHYADLTGESPFMRRSIDLHHEKAAADGTHSTRLRKVAVHFTNRTSLCRHASSSAAAEMA